MNKELPGKHILFSMLKNFKLNSVFFRMLTIMFGVFFVVCIINFAGIVVTKQQALNNEENNSEFYLDYSDSYMQKLVQKLQDYMYSLEYDSNVVYLRSLPKNSNYAQNNKEVWDTSQKLGLLMGLMDEVSDIYIYLPNLNRVITNGGVEEMQTFFSVNYKGDFDQWNSLLKGKYLNTFVLWNIDIAPKATTDFSKLNLINSFYQGSALQSVIVANLNQNLVKEIFQGNTYAENRKVYITDKNLLILSSNTTEQTKNLDISKATLAKAIKGSFYNNEYLISYQFLPENSIYFIVMTPKEIIFKNVRNLTFASYVFLAIMLVTGLVLSVFLSQQFYLPIGQMLKDMQRFATASIGLKGQLNEYDYIKNNMNVMYTDNKNLEQIIQQSMPFVLDIIVMKLLHGGYETDSATILASQYNIKFKPGCYIAVLMKCSHSYINITQKLESELNTVIKEMIAINLFSVLKNNQDEIIVVAFAENSEQIGLVASQFSKLSDQLSETYEDEDFYFGIGCAVNNIYKINLSYTNAQQALSARRIQDNEKVVCAAGNEIKENKSYIPVDFEDRYKNALFAGNLDMSEDFIYEILDHNYSKNITFQSYYKLCLWLQGIIERIIDDSSDLMVKKVAKDSLENLFLAGDIIELNNRLLKNNRIVCTAFLNEKKSDTNFIKILKYVDANFNTNINLDAVANQFGYNSSYLSRLFKQIKGISFSDYLGKKRIEYAKKLLVHPGKTIKEIAEESGYNSTGIFIKAFEKVESVSPGEYRKRQKN